MNRHKYWLNPHTLSFEKIVTPLPKRIAKVSILFGISVAVATALVFAFSQLFDTPKERYLRREHANLVLKFNLFERRLAEADQQLSEIQQRDNHIYRAIFDADTIPSTLRLGGIGGANHYGHLAGFRASDILVRTATLVDQLAWRAYVQSKSFDEVTELARNKEQMVLSVPAIQPVSIQDLARISAPFGFRSDPFTRQRRMHTGIDFAGTVGTPVYATGNGVVREAYFCFDGYGKMILIDHGFGYQSLYAHLSRFLVSPGDTVVRGQVIAELGNSGRSTGAHLHYEVIYRNQPVNPINYFFNDMSSEEFELMVANAAQRSRAADPPAQAGLASGY